MADHPTVGQPDDDPAELGGGSGGDSDAVPRCPPAGAPGVSPPVHLVVL